ncbi:hypothetical protein IFR05_008664 [Cadophora sp. M221]|nr:hypothetical protein IFR05_008664 [Cadophora sp. M221]
MKFSIITIVIGVLASSVIAGPVAQPARKPAATAGQPCTVSLEGSLATGVCTEFGDCGLSGENSNEFVRIKGGGC